MIPKMNKVMVVNFNQVDNETTDIEIYDDIAKKKSYDWWTDKEGTEVTPENFKAQLNDVSTPNICVRINSNGGSIDAANAICVAIREAKAKGKKVTCKIDGVCASAAVQIALSCDDRQMYDGAIMMIHDPMSLCYGYYNAGELSKTIEALNKYKDTIINQYEKETNLSREECSKLMEETTYMTADEAVEKGFVHSIMFEQSEEDALNNIDYGVINCANNSIPDAIKKKIALNKSTKKDMKGKKGANKMENIKNVQDLTTAYPDLVNQIKEEGAKAERERIQAIDKLQGKVSNEELDKAKYVDFSDAQTVAFNALSNGTAIAPKPEPQEPQNQAGANILNAMAGENPQVGGVVNSGNEISGSEEEKQANAEFINKVVSAQLKAMGRA